MKLSKLQEALTPSQIASVGTGEDEEQEHYLTAATQSREAIITGTKTYIKLTNHIKNLIRELVAMQLKFKNTKMYWHDIEYIVPNNREPEYIFPAWVAEMNAVETKVSFRGMFQQLRKSILKLSTDYFNNYHFKLNPKEVNDFLIECGFPKGHKLDTPYLWKLNFIYTTSDEIGGHLIRTHSSPGLPTILRGADVGYAMYLSFIHSQGHACSDEDTSAEARTIWAKLLMSESTVIALVSPNGKNSMVISKYILSDERGKEIVYKLADKFFSVTFKAGLAWVLKHRPDLLDQKLKDIAEEVAPILQAKGEE